MKPNIKDVSDMNFLGFARFFILQCYVGKLQLYTKSCFDEGGGGEGGGTVLGMYWWNFYPVIAHGIATECGAL